ANLKAKYVNESEDTKHELTLLEILLQKEQLTRKDVITFMLDMFMAGIDTTSHTLAFTLYLLARNPKAQRRLQDEIDSVLGKEIEPIDEKHLAKLSYLKACIKESLRIFPLVIGFNRVLTEDAVIGGYLIPKGYWVVSMSTLRSKDEACFPRPNEYLPERWLRDKPYGDIHPYASLPFSHGSRMCIGRRIAEQEMYIFLARP
ncbi:putative cytochrome P450 49a1, partial [Armadillidium vulgare]